MISFLLAYSLCHLLGCESGNIHSRLSWTAKFLYHFLLYCCVYVSVNFNKRFWKYTNTLKLYQNTINRWITFLICWPHEYRISDFVSMTLCYLIIRLFSKYIYLELYYALEPFVVVVFLNSISVLLRYIVHRIQFCTSGSYKSKHLRYIAD